MHFTSCENFPVQWFDAEFVSQIFYSNSVGRAKFYKNSYDSNERRTFRIRSMSSGEGSTLLNESRTSSFLFIDTEFMKRICNSSIPALLLTSFHILKSEVFEYLMRIITRRINP